MPEMFIFAINYLGLKKMRIKEFYIELCGANILMAFEKAAAKGIKKLEFTEEELLNFIIAFSRQLPHNVNVSSGEFNFWGIKIKKINDDNNKA